MLVKLSPSSLKDSRWYEFVIRVVLGGLATVLTGVVGSRFGPSVGGLFLALPAIFCASATLIEKHEIRRKRQASAVGTRRGQRAAAVDAAGAALGSLGMLAFAASFYEIVGRSVGAAFVTALLVWMAVAALAWWIWRGLRLASRARQLAGNRSRDGEFTSGASRKRPF